MTDALLEVLRDGRALGFLGPGPVAPHLAHARAFGRVVARACSDDDLGVPSMATPEEEPRRPARRVRSSGPGRVLDLGSGGGLPGVVLAVVWPGTTVVLLDAQHRRAAFLTEAVRRLGVATRVEVCEGRAEVLGHRAALRGSFDAVVARAFGRPAVTAECAAPFIRPGGVLVVSEPPPRAEASEPAGGGPAPCAGVQSDAPTDVPIGDGGDVQRAAGHGGRWPRAGLAQLGMDAAVPVGDEFRFVVVRQETACPERFPRRVGLPAKRPLF